MDVHRRPPALRFWQYARKKLQARGHTFSRSCWCLELKWLMFLLINPNLQLNDFSWRCTSPRIENESVKQEPGQCHNVKRIITL